MREQSHTVSCVYIYVQISAVVATAPSFMLFKGQFETSGIKQVTATVYTDTHSPTPPARAFQRVINVVSPLKAPKLSRSIFTMGKREVLQLTVHQGQFEITFRNETLGSLKREELSHKCPAINLTMHFLDGEVTYKWDFGDDSPVETTLVNEVHHVFQRTGYLSLSLDVKNTFESAKHTFSIKVYETVSLRALTAVPGGQTFGSRKPIDFVVTVITGSELTFRWFVDGELIQETATPKTSITFDHAANYTISLNASNRIAWQEAQTSIEVVAPISGKLQCYESGRKQKAVLSLMKAKYFSYFTTRHTRVSRRCLERFPITSRLQR